jgi:ribosomal protein L37AE/L43A
VKIKCPKCKKNAELSMDFSVVKCENCDLDMSYGEYVKFIAHNETTYSDILGDSAGSLDEWD